MAYEFGTVLYDLKSVPNKEYPLDNSEIEEMRIKHLQTLMEGNDVTLEQYEKFGLKV